MRRIMIVTNSLTGGGAERSMNLVGSELTKLGWPIALVPINAGDPDLVTPTCEVFALNRQWRGSPFGTLRAIIEFNQIAKSWKPDVVILNCDLPELFGALLFMRKALVVVEHSSLAWSTRPLPGKIIRKILKMRKAVWIAVSSNLRIWPDGQSPREVIQNPLLPSTKGAVHSLVKAPIRRLVFIGRLTPEKQPERIIEIGNRTALPVEVIGDGFLLNSLAEKAKSKDAHITFHGRMRDPWSFIAAGDLLVVPSVSEGDGLVVVEGMREGVPLLLSDIQDFRRFDLPEQSYCQSVDDFVERVNQFKEDIASLVIPSEISEPILKSRSPQVIGKAWARLLESI